MRQKPIGIILLAGVCFAAGLAGIAAFWAAWPRTANTSPLAALFALTWGCTYLAAGVLTWRRCRLAVPAFFVATALLVILLRFIFPAAIPLSD